MLEWEVHTQPLVLPADVNTHMELKKQNCISTVTSNLYFLVLPFKSATEELTTALCCSFLIWKF